MFNTAVAARDGRRVAIYRKRLLPTYDVFDEGRYVEPGDRGLTLRLRGRRVAVTICEDIWNDKTFWKNPLYPTDPVAELVRGDADVHVNISASPYTLGKNRLRRRMMSRIARRSGVPLVHCNLVGGNDGLVFDGASTAFDARGRLIGRGETLRGRLLDDRPPRRPRALRAGGRRDPGPSPGARAGALGTTPQSADSARRSWAFPAASTPR